MEMMSAGLCASDTGINVRGWILFLLRPACGMRMCESVMWDTHPRTEV